MANEMVKHGTWSVEQAKKELAKVQQETGGGRFYSMKEGKNILRVLPPPVGVESPFLVVYEHYISNESGGHPAKFACPRRNEKRPCPACARADVLYRSGDPEDQKQARAYFAKLRAYANVIDRTEPERGPLIASFPKTVYESLCKLFTDEDAGGDFVDPSANGYDIIIERKGQGLKTEYPMVGIARKPSPLGDASWLSKQNDLSQFAALASYDQLVQQMKGERERQPGSDDEDENPAPKSARPKRTADSDVYDATYDD